jgi:isopentenyldiphosphate isomerase
MSRICDTSSKVELTDVYDSNKKRTGVVLPRSEWKGEGFRLVVQMCVFSEDKLLIQKRAMTKKSNPGLWDVSAAGQVDAGETNHEGAAREIREELGLEYDITDSDFYITLRLPHVFNDVYILEYNGGEITLQESEVDGYTWATEDEIMRMIDDKEFIQYKPELIRSFFEAYRKGIRNAPDLTIETSYL